ncbi:MAG: hypothetical protein K8W52_03480 [Deltaproteobacteria bacterium]|nr:hypothetical protein [Deltaproteobacteria bacterium]
MAMRAHMTELKAASSASLLLATKDETDDTRGRWHFLNALDRVDDPAVRHRMMENFAQQSGESLPDFIAEADWDGERDRDQALALISPERDAAEQTLQAMTPGDRAHLDDRAAEWTQQVLAVTRADGADTGEGAAKIARVLGPRTPEEIEAIRAAVRKQTFGEHAIYEELDRSMSGKDEDEAVAGLSGDPVHAAAVGLRNAVGDPQRADDGDRDPARMKEILRGLDAKQLAELRQRERFLGTGWMVDAVPEGEDREEIRRLIAGDRAGADAAYLTDLLKKPTDGMLSLDGLDARHRATFDARQPANVLKEFEAKPAADVIAARAAWDKEAAATGGASWDDMLAERFAGDTPTYLRLSALARGDRAEAGALAVRDGIRTDRQDEIETALTNPDLSSKDPARRAAAIEERQALSAHARRHDELQHHIVGLLTGHGIAAPGREIDEQLDDHYRDYAEARRPEVDAARYLFDPDNYDGHREGTAHDGQIASTELLETGVLSSATQIHRDRDHGDTKHEAAILDGVASTHDLDQLAADFKRKYGGDLLADPKAEVYAFRADVAKATGDPRSREDVARAIAREEMDAEETKIANLREVGVRAERRPDVELRLQRELYAKQHSGSLDDHERLRAALGGNIGTEDLAREQLAATDAMLEPRKHVFGLAPRDLAPGTDRTQFDRIDRSLTSTLELQREEKQKHAERTGRIFGTIAKLAALVTAQPELIAMLDVASGLGEMAIKSSIATEAYDASDDVKGLALTGAIDLATIGLAHLGAVKPAAVSEATQLGERTAARALDEGATAEAKEAIVKDGARAAAGEAKAVEKSIASTPATTMDRGTGAVTAQAEHHAGQVARRAEHAEQRALQRAERGENPHAVRDRVDALTGVDKGAEYEQFREDMKRFYANQELEAANVTQVRNRRWDPHADGAHVRIDSQYDVRTFAYDNENLTQASMDIHFQPGAGVAPAEVARMRQNAVEGVDKYFNFGPQGRLHRLPNQSRLQVELGFVDEAHAADLVVGVEHPGFDPRTGDWRSTTQTEWVTSQSTPTVAAHEVAHQMGLIDEYPHAKFLHRATHRDGSLMGNFHTDVAPTRLHQRSVDQIGHDIEVAEHSRRASTRTTDQFPAVSPNAPVLPTLRREQPFAPDRVADEWLARQGDVPEPGTRAETRAQYRARRSGERAEASVRDVDGPLKNPNNPSQKGHGHGRHGWQTTEAQQVERVETGRNPDALVGEPNGFPADEASRFGSPQAEAEALARGKRALATQLETEAKAAAAAGLPPPSLLQPNGHPRRIRPLVKTHRPEGFGTQQKLRTGPTGAPLLDANGKRVAVPHPSRLGHARVVWQYIPADDRWGPVTYFPENVEP